MKLTSLRFHASTLKRAIAITSDLSNIDLVIANIFENTSQNMSSQERGVTVLASTGTHHFEK